MTDPDRPRCECPEEMLLSPPLADDYSSEEKKAWGHMPGKCPSTSQLQLYRRGAGILRLCSACTTRIDVPLTGPLNV
jgi:hypothetical protein